MKRKNTTLIFGAILFWLVGILSPGETSAEVSVNIGIGVPLPTVVVSAPPAVVLIPGTPVYYAPDVSIALFFYSGRWYRKHTGHWYVATYYNGPWAYVSATRIPSVLVQLPGEYYDIHQGHQKIPYGQLKKHWKRWEKEHPKHGKHHHEDDDD